MTIASEITRLQWAKADAKASIENKGVSVPADATVDTYHTYIDQISYRGAWMTKLITPSEYTNQAGTPHFPPTSWEYNWNAYWIAELDWGSGNTAVEWMFLCKMIPSTWVEWASLGIYYTSPSRVWGRNSQPAARKVYKKADSSSVYAFSFCTQWPTPSSPWTPEGTYCIGFGWNTANMATSSLWWVVWTLGDYNPANYWFDLTWYTEVTGSRWADSIGFTGYSSNQKFYFKIKDTIS